MPVWVSALWVGCEARWGLGWWGLFSPWYRLILVGSNSSAQSIDDLHTMLTRVLNNPLYIMGENFMCMDILMRWVI